MWLSACIPPLAAMLSTHFTNTAHRMPWFQRGNKLKLITGLSHFSCNCPASAAQRDGADTTITLAAEAGQLQLNVMELVISFSLLAEMAKCGMRLL